MRKTWVIVTVIIVLLGALAYAFGDRVPASIGRSDNTDRLTDGEALTVMTVGKGAIARFVTASGNLQPNRRIDLPFNTAGRVEDIAVEIGERVEAGDILAVLSNRQQQLAYERAKINYEIALIDSPPNVVQEREFDMESARETLESTILRAPFAGLVTDVRVSPGESVSATEVIVQLIDDTTYKVDVSIDELDINQIQIGQNAIVTLDADRSAPRRGVVDHIGIVATVQQNMVTVPVTVRLTDVDAAMRPGYTATVQIAVAEANDVVRVPVEAVYTDGGMASVTIVQDGEPLRVPVVTGVTDGVWIEIVSGLEAGDSIVGLNYRGGQGSLQGRFPGQTTGGGQMRGIVPSATPFGGTSTFRR